MSVKNNEEERKKLFRNKTFNEYDLRQTPGGSKTRCKLSSVEKRKRNQTMVLTVKELQEIIKAGKSLGQNEEKTVNSCNKEDSSFEDSDQNQQAGIGITDRKSNRGGKIEDPEGETTMGGKAEEIDEEIQRKNEGGKAEDCSSEEESFQRVLEAEGIIPRSPFKYSIHGQDIIL